MENEQDRDAIRKAKMLYSSCMNESKEIFFFCSVESLTQFTLKIFIELLIQLVQCNVYYWAFKVWKNDGKPILMDEYDLEFQFFSNYHDYIFCYNLDEWHKKEEA